MDTIKSKQLEIKIINRIYNFFVESNDFNGIPLRNISKEFEIDYRESIDFIKKLVAKKIVSIQSSTNPHIIYFQHYPIENQLVILDNAKEITETSVKIRDLIISHENTDAPICLFPSLNYLQANRDTSLYGLASYRKLLALGHPQMSPYFFEINVLERYLKDPRFDLKFEDFSGSISVKYDDNNNPIVREEDQIYLKSFGLGFDSKNNRVAVVYLRYLKDLTPEHQVFWKNHESFDDCKMIIEYYKNTIKGNWNSSYSIFTAFIEELKCLNDLSLIIFGKKLFKRDFDKVKRPKSFTFFFTPTLSNYYEFVMLLDKMISDNINKDFFNGKVELFDYMELKTNVIERKPKGTLRLLEEFVFNAFNDINKEEILKVFENLKNVRHERQMPAHKILENDFNLEYIEKQKTLMISSYFSIKTLRILFLNHPLGINYNIPKWLDENNIVVY